MVRRNGKELSPKSKYLLDKDLCEDERVSVLNEICQNESQELLKKEIENSVCSVKEIEGDLTYIYLHFLSGDFFEQSKSSYKEDHFPEMPPSTFHDKVDKVQRKLREEIFPILKGKGLSLDDFFETKKREYSMKNSETPTKKTLSPKENLFLESLALYVQKEADAVIGSRVYSVERKENLPLKPKLVRPIMRKLVSLAEEGALLDPQNLELMFYWAVYCCENDLLQRDILETVLAKSCDDQRKAICLNFIAMHEAVQKKLEYALAWLNKAENLNPGLPLTQHNKACVYCLLYSKNEDNPMGDLLKNANDCLDDLCELLQSRDDAEEEVISFIEFFGTDQDLKPIRTSSYKNELVQKFNALIPSTSSSKERVRRLLGLIVVLVALMFLFVYCFDKKTSAEFYKSNQIFVMLGQNKSKFG